MTTEKAIEYYQKRYDVEVRHGGVIGTGKIVAFSGSFLTIEGRRKGLGGGLFKLPNVPASALSPVTVR